jgi:GAF domain-containing protein
VKSAPKPQNESERLDTLRAYELLDTEPEAAFDAITKLAANLCEVPIALVSLVDADRQWFKSRCGLDPTSTGRDVAFCAHAILQNDIFEIPDACEDPRFADNPLVTGPPHVRFYAGVPLIEPAGLPLGTLCVIDHKPRKLTQRQREQLRHLAQSIVGLIVMRIRRSELEEYRMALAASERACLALQDHATRLKASGR